MGTREAVDCVEAASLLEFIERDLGAKTVSALLAEFCGGGVYIPLNPQEHHRVCKVIGVEKVRRISKVFGSGSFSLPLGNFGAFAVRREKIKNACIEGRTTNSIVREFGASARTVHKVRSRLRREGAMA